MLNNVSAPSFIRLPQQAVNSITFRWQIYEKIYLMSIFIFSYFSGFQS